jgi:[NiFe] hydrogenase assembly HybE family chaperone
MPEVGSLTSRVAALEALFGHVAATRMQGVPILHPGLAVQAVGFEPAPDGFGAVGVLVTPWFMNLVWLPLATREGEARTEQRPAPGGAADAARPLPALAVGATRMRAVGNECFDFIGAFEPDFGAYEACSLFSPMFDFADQATAVATAEQVLAILRSPPAAVHSDGAEPARAAAPEPGAAPSRRALLFGRGSAGADR